MSASAITFDRLTVLMMLTVSSIAALFMAPPTAATPPPRNNASTSLAAAHRVLCDAKRKGSLRDELLVAQCRCGANYGKHTTLPGQPNAYDGAACEACGTPTRTASSSASGCSRECSVKLKAHARKVYRKRRQCEADAENEASSAPPPFVAGYSIAEAHPQVASALARWRESVTPEAAALSEARVAKLTIVLPAPTRSSGALGDIDTVAPAAVTNSDPDGNITARWQYCGLRECCGWGHRLSRMLEMFTTAHFGHARKHAVLSFGTCPASTQDFASALMDSSEDLYMVKDIYSNLQPVPGTRGAPLAGRHVKAINKMQGHQCGHTPKNTAQVHRAWYQRHNDGRTVMDKKRFDDGKVIRSVFIL